MRRKRRICPPAFEPLEGPAGAARRFLTGVHATTALNGSARVIVAPRPASAAMSDPRATPHRRAARARAAERALRIQPESRRCSWLERTDRGGRVARRVLRASCCALRGILWPRDRRRGSPPDCMAPVERHARRAPSVDAAAYSCVPGHARRRRATAPRPPSDCEIARRLDCTGKTAGKWRTRFAEEGLAGWMSGPGRGVPGHFPPGEIRRSQGAGVRAAGRDRPAAVAVVGG
jgi:hypothetical protein